MKKMFLMLALTLVTMMNSAMTIKELRDKGLPTDAVPAKYYFEQVLYNDNVRPFTEQDVNNTQWSTFQSDYSFFIVEKKREHNFSHIELWMYDHEKDILKQVFTQTGTPYESLLIEKMDVCQEVATTEMPIKDNDTGRSCTILEKSAQPIVVMATEEYTGTCHALKFVLILNPQNGLITKLDNQILVGVLRPLSNMLMAAEMDLPAQYILTTSTEINSEDVLNGEDVDTISILYRHHLQPILNVYSASGKYVGQMSLPIDLIDEVR